MLFATDLPPFLAGTLASVFAGAVLTSVGALPAFGLFEIRPRVQNAMLGFAAGVMLAATFFSLLLPSLERAESAIGTRSGAALAVIAALLAGAAAMHLGHRVLPHQHFHKGREGPDAARLARVWLFVLAITIHNLPEGLAVGVAAGGGDPSAGLAVTLG